MATTFSASLAKMRQVKGVSQRKAAGDLGVSQALLSHYENGIREPGLDFLCRACDYYEVSSDFMLGRVNPKPEQPELPVRTEANASEFDMTELTEMDRRLLSDSIGLIHQMLRTTDDKELENDVFAYFSLAVFRLIRDMFAGGADKLADIDGPASGFASDAAMKLAELEIIRKANSGEYPAISEMSKEYPDLYRSLTQVLFCAGSRIKKI